MTKAFLSLALTLSLAWTPSYAQAQFIDPQLLPYLPLIVALLAASGSSTPANLPTRRLNKIELLNKLADGKTVLPIEDAQKILENKSSYSAGDRLIVANSVMAKLMASGFWLDRDVAITIMSAGPPGMSMSFEIENDFEKAFKQAGVQPNIRQKNIYHLFSSVIEFENDMRATGVPADILRNRIVAGYFLGLCASTSNLAEGKRQGVIQI